MKRTYSSTPTAPKNVVWNRFPFAATSRQALSNFSCADSSRARPSPGVAGPLAGSIALLVLAFGKPSLRRTRLNRTVRTIGCASAGILGNFDGRPAAMLADSSSDRATCSTIWLGDHLPGARGVDHAGPQHSAAAINWSTACLLALRAA